MASNGIKMANGFNTAQKRILVTGGAGYIGSHTALQLLLEEYQVVIADNLNNSVEEAVRRVVGLAGKNGKNLRFCLVDLCDKEGLEKVFSSLRFDGVIHFAGLKAVGASVANPLLYYYNNLVGTLNLFEVMKNHSCKKLVFSSSATVYGQPKLVPCTEDFPREAVNPYGQTKLFVEHMCYDMVKADPEWGIILLRYFNPVAAHPSGLIGEDPRGVPNNLMPFVQQVAVGRRSELTVYGNDYPTKDGTGVRDYVHVMDLAEGHLAALRKLFMDSDTGCTAYNLGTGKGVSVLEMIQAFEKASGKKIPYRVAARRPGDCAEVYASTLKAYRELGWKAKYGVDEMCRDQWNWASKNPWGYNVPHADLNGAANAFPTDSNGAATATTAESNGDANAFPADSNGAATATTAESNGSLNRIHANLKGVSNNPHADSNGTGVPAYTHLEEAGELSHPDAKLVANLARVGYHGATNCAYGLMLENGRA